MIDLEVRDEGLDGHWSRSVVKVVVTRYLRANEKENETESRLLTQNIC